MPTNLFSAVGFKDYLCRRMLPQSADSTMSRIRSLRPAGLKELPADTDLLQWLCGQLEENPSPSYARSLIDGIIETVLLSSPDSENQRTLADRLTTLRRFRDYADAVLMADDEADDEADAASGDLPEEAELQQLPASALVPQGIAPVPAGIHWISVRETTVDPFIGKAPQSVRGKFRGRLVTQSRKGGTTVPFPLKAVRSIFHNAEDFERNSPTGLLLSHKAWLDAWKAEIDDVIETITDRILFYVAEDRRDPRGFTRLPDGMWAYTLASIDEIGIDSAGHVYIKLFGSTDESPLIHQVYSFDFSSKAWSPMTGVFTLRQIDLDHDPEMQEILRRLAPGLQAMQALKALGVTPRTTVAQLRNLWPQIEPLLSGLHCETLRILSFYNIDAMLHIHNSRKQISKSSAGII